MKAKIALSSVVLLTAAMTLSSCGSDGGDSASGGGSGLTKVSVGYTSEGGLQIPFYWALEKGLFKENGLDVKPVKVTSSSSLVPAIKSGSLDIGTGDGAAVCSGILGGNDLTVVGANLNTFALETWARKDATSFQDLAGKTVAVTGSGSTSDFALEASLKANGMKRSDVKVAFVNTLPATVAAVQSGAVDATPVVPPHGDALAPKGFKMIYDTSKLPHVSTAMAVQPGYAKDHADAVRGFTKAMREAVVAASDPANDAAISAIVAKRAAVSKKEAEYTVKYFQPLWNKSLVVQPDVWASTCTEARRKTKPKPGVDPGKALDMSFLDQSAK